MRNKKRFFIFGISLLLLNAVVPNEQVMAWRHIKLPSLAENSGGTGDSGGGGQTGIPQIPIGKVSIDGTGLYANRKFQCNYSYRINSNSDLSVDVYDFDGNSLAPNSADELIGHKFKAGTWIGMNITETKAAAWQVSSVTVGEIKKKYQCNYEKPGAWTCSYDWQYIRPSKACPSGYEEYSSNIAIKKCRKLKSCTQGSGNTTTEEIIKNYYDNVTIDDCPNKSGYNKVSVEEIGTTSITVRSGSILDECEDKSIQEVHSSAQASVGTATSLVEYLNTNDINDDTQSIIEPTPSGYEHKYTSESSGVITKTFTYTPYKICMNMKTANVSYTRDCKENEVEIKNTSNYWHYFIPLNATSDDEFYIGLTDNADGYITKNACLNAITNTMKDTYKNVIALKSKNGAITTFTGNSRTDQIAVERIYNNGGKCYVSTKINFEIEQKFYNEETNDGEKVFKGFNFYYKPIDISNPFPNGLDNDSYWSGLYNQSDNTVKINEKEIDLDKSFDNLTYVSIISGNTLKAIRSYNNNEFTPYTSWDNMYLTGASKFVEDYLTRNVSIESFYQLGCGPANEGRWHCR